MKRFLNSKWGERIILISALALNLLFTIIYYSSHFTASAYDSGRVNYTLWNAQYLVSAEYMIVNFSVYFVVAFVVGLVLYALGAVVLFVQNKKWALYGSVSYNTLLSIVALIVHVAFESLFTAGAVACIVISLMISGATLAFLIIRRNVKREDEAAEALAEQAETEQNVAEPVVTPRRVKTCKFIMLICECVATFVLALTFFVPLYSETKSGSTTSYVLIKALSTVSYPIYVSISFIVLFVAFFAMVLYFVSTLTLYFRSSKRFFAQASNYMYGSSVFTLVFFVLGFCLAFYSNVAAGETATRATTVSYICFLLSVVTLIAFSVARGFSGEEDVAAAKNAAKKVKAEPFVYVVLLTAVTYVSLVFNIVKIVFTVGGYEAQNVALTGYKLLTTYGELESGFQLLAFVLFVTLLVSGVMLVLSVMHFVTRSKDYYKVVKTASISNVVLVALIGLFGLYFKIAQKINMENIESLLAQYGLGGLNYEYTVSSQTIYALIVSVIILIVMIARGVFGLSNEPTFELSLPQDGEAALPVTSVGDKAASEVAAADAEKQTYQEPVVADFDACPAFTELDSKTDQFERELTVRRENLFEGITLPNLVRFVVDYARECRLHLSYSLEDMATFVAGLGSSRLTILQGMSGTGKTSLPKIFTEAIMGTCEIVEVESSWRDKNELLGYYNEFSRCFTPKKFTQCLYKARLNSTVPTFIVLDEMNLSRIEYYFSDFLSLMENEEDKREIKLLNVKLFQTVNGEKINYKGLVDGHTIKIPANVWFIGTANRDESTFEISDKVYDRAQTMNFNKRAPKIHSFSEPLAQRFAPYDMLIKLFDEAKRTAVFEAEDNVVIQKVEKLLLPYNISFGNRILNQMESFVKIYCACFGDKEAVEKEAVEKILLSKVVSKLESKVVENKESLAAEFDKLGLYACSAFIRKLNED